jgi:general secretion pathway protein G
MLMNRIHSLTLASSTRSAKSRRALRRLRQQAMTLTEIMIVIIIMAMIAAAVGAAVIPKLNQAKVSTARTDAQAVRSAVEGYMMANTTNDCPTIDELLEQGELRRGSRTTDPWNNAFKIECTRDGADVTSAGPDGEWGSDDDIN